MAKDPRKPSSANAKPAARRKPGASASAPPVKSKSPRRPQDEDENVDQEEMELEDDYEEEDVEAYDEDEIEEKAEPAPRRKKLKPVPTRAKASTKSPAKPTKKRAPVEPEDEYDDEEVAEELDEDEEEEVEEKPARKGWFWGRKKAVAEDEFSEEEVDEDEEDAVTAQTADEGDEDSGDDSDSYRSPLLARGVVRNMSAFVASTVAHAAVVILLALWMTDNEVKVKLMEIVSVPIQERDEELQVIELEQRIEAVKEISEAVMSSSPTAGAEGAAGGGGPSGGGDSSPKLDNNVVSELGATATGTGIDFPLTDAPSSRKLVAEVPDGFLGDARAVVDDYKQAMDRITQEIMWMLNKGKVLVVWCFDESESMKDDQREIRDRVEKVYLELGLIKATNNDILNTAITSYGGSFHVHTPKPTADLFEIRAAIDAVPNDPTGKEMMTMAVGTSIAKFRDYAKRTDRQMALILVTDESGDTETNNTHLEEAIATAKSSQCKIYTLGREAVFGYPYAHIRWIHPQTGGHHWLPIDRGPETAFIEQLQTDGFHRRYDAHSSGFGPYEQARMSKETGGIFFMLPSEEQNLVHRDKRRYELEAMRSYIPDMRSRMEVVYDRDGSPLRTVIWKVINDLNPYKPEISRIIEMRMSFPLYNPELREAVLKEQQKARIYLDYLARAQKELENMSYTREQEPLPRWQANYDLIYAQLIAYQARIYEYGAYLETFMRNPKTAPAFKPPDLTLVHWDIASRPAIVDPKTSQPYIDKAKVLFEAVKKNHPGTPWSARAEIELRRGFGVELFPDYHRPRPPLPPGTVVMPVPKL